MYCFQGKQNDLTLLSFWLAIVTELRQFLHSDRHLSNFLTEPIEVLHDSQQLAMRYVIVIIVIILYHLANIYNVVRCYVLGLSSNVFSKN